MGGTAPTKSREKGKAKESGEKVIPVVEYNDKAKTDYFKENKETLLSIPELRTYQNKDGIEMTMTSQVLRDRSVALGLKVSLSAFHYDCLSRLSRLLSYRVRCGCDPWSLHLPRWSASHRMAVIVSQPRQPPLTPTMSTAAAEHSMNLDLCDEDGYVTRVELEAALEWAKTEEEGKALYPAEDLYEAEEALKNMPQVTPPPMARARSTDRIPALPRAATHAQPPSEPAQSAPSPISEPPPLAPPIDARERCVARPAL